jgi:glycogen operon protein
MWLKADGSEFTEGDWGNPEARAVGVLLNGNAVRDCDPRCRPIRDDTLLLACNASDAAMTFCLPQRWGTGPWQVAIDTSQEIPPGHLAAPGFPLGPRSLVLLARPSPAGQCP